MSTKQQKKKKKITEQGEQLLISSSKYHRSTPNLALLCDYIKDLLITKHRKEN